MIRLLRWWAALVLALLGVMAVTAPARADSKDETPASWNVASYHVDAKVDQHGVTTVTVDLRYDFGSDPGHGPFLALVTRMPDNSNPDRWRMIDVDVQSVTSSTGANTALKLTSESDSLMIRVGSERLTYTGIQQYTIVYTTTGLVQTNNPVSGLDEVNWTVLSPAADVPINDVQVTVSGPADITSTACFTGTSLRTPCATPAGGASATWTVSRLDRREGVQVVAGYPVGTFTDVALRYTKRYRLANMFPLTPTTVGGGAVVAGVGLASVLGLARRTGRDRAYLGLIPGLAPVAGADAPEGAAQKTPVTVQFQPPKNARPGEIGVLLDETADNRDVTATIIDLAVRGHLRIEPGEGADFTLVKTGHPDQLAPFEVALLSNLFVSAPIVSQAMLAQPVHAKALPTARSNLYTRVSKERAWFRANPQIVRATWRVLGVALLVGAVVLSLALGTAGLGLFGLGLVVPGIALVVAARFMPARTAEGSAVLAQAKGFELYLRTAEADQIKFEEGIDVFSRYLPYAIVFGVAERWAGIFQDLAARGVYQGDTAWMGGNAAIWMSPSLNLGSMVSSMSASMSTSMNAAVSAAHASSAGSSGSSGFGGGGGFGGGSVGGW